MAERDHVTGGLLIRTSEGNPRISPLVKAAAVDMVRFAGEFGFTPAARARITAGPLAGQVGGKFGRLLGGP